MTLRTSLLLPVLLPLGLAAVPVAAQEADGTRTVPVAIDGAGQAAPAQSPASPAAVDEARDPATPAEPQPRDGAQAAPSPGDSQDGQDAPAPADPPGAREPEQVAPGAAPDDDAVAGPSDDPDAVESATTRVPLEEIRRYVGLFNAIRAGYVDPVDDRKLMDAAIRGLLLDLDPHSAYLEKNAAQAFNEGTTGAYDGIGVEVLQLPDGKVRVIAPIDDTPAAKAGIRAGDVIVSVDGRELRPADAEGAGPLRGPPGSSLVLGVVREGEAQPLQITVRRETIRVASVRGRMLEPGYGYVRISAFQVETGEDFSRTVAKLRDDAGGRLRGLVIDLRSNPGGLLTAAVRVADDLLDKGRIVSTRGRIDANDTEFNATPGDLLEGAPVVVLIDAGSASASEVLAGALHDHGRARIVGSRSFGKGSVQTLLPLGNGDAVKLTTARYYTPSGRSIQARGIDPDVVLKPEGDDGQAAGPRQTEAALPGHLRGDEEEGASAGDVLPGEGPIQAALAELKKPAAPRAAAAAN
ncbi:S41 family peptidase [Luteimonas composti]|uniref:S41 family peptidase n=1 Tax=Luteimonas composti TaxID=398257 RepID=A0ABT6MV85_9GAMM|nr:S41 family peptidase [Luteimonas composti]MDH7454552.1 S41 family peptidase [Luteimonas composti]